MTTKKTTAQFGQKRLSVWEPVFIARVRGRDSETANGSLKRGLEWSQNIGECRESRPMNFNEGANISPYDKEMHLGRAQPETPACGYTSVLLELSKIFCAPSYALGRQKCYMA